MRFVKMHGIGNDYVYVDAVSQPALAERPDLSEIARRISDRHTGVGSDGLILVCEPAAGTRAHVRMRMFNSDGSESEMCGNGVRCVAKFAHDRLGIRNRPMLVETGRGVLSIDYETAGGRLTRATVDMGEPILDLRSVPVEESALGAAFEHGERAVVLGPGAPNDGEDRWVGSFVSMGNPHAVFFDSANARLRAGGLERLELDRIGPRIERHRAFPRRVNAHFVCIQTRAEATMRTWERGAGATMACGTGACAVLVAGVRTGRLDRRALLHLPGGDLVIEWPEQTNRVLMTGPAEDICEGEWTLPTEVPQVVWTHHPEIRTPRLLLRACTLEDAPRIAELAGAKEIAATTLLIPHPYTLRDATSWIATHQTALERGEAVNYAITMSGELVGMIGLRIQRAHQRAELGYWVGVPYWGRGIATEAARALVMHGFDRLGLRRIYAYHFAGNPASGRVLQKAGMKPEGVQIGHIIKNGVPQDDVMYGIVRG